MCIEAISYLVHISNLAWARAFAFRALLTFHCLYEMYVPALSLYLAVVRALIALRVQPRVAILREPTAYYLKKGTSVSGFAYVNDTVLRVAESRF